MRELLLWLGIYVGVALLLFFVSEVRHPEGRPGFQHALIHRSARLQHLPYQERVRTAARVEVYTNLLLAASSAVLPTLLAVAVWAFWRWS